MTSSRRPQLILEKVYLEYLATGSDGVYLDLMQADNDGKFLARDPNPMMSIWADGTGRLMVHL